MFHVKRPRAGEGIQSWQQRNAIASLQIMCALHECERRIEAAGERVRCIAIAAVDVKRRIIDSNSTGLALGSASVVQCRKVFAGELNCFRGNGDASELHFDYLKLRVEHTD